MFKAVENLREQKGFTLIELLIVVAIIGILAAVAIPGYIGMQERGRRGAIQRTTGSNESELLAWMSSAKNGGVCAGLGLLTEVDFTGDGLIGAGERNCDLAAGGIVTEWGTHAVHAAEQSPWGGAALWNTIPGATATLAACEALATSGQITVCAGPGGEGAAVTQIFLIAHDATGAAVGALGGNTVYSKVLTAD